MEPLHKNIERAFDREKHLVDLHKGEFVEMYDELGKVLDGIRGKAGAAGLSDFDEELGLDYIEMQPGSSFPLHVHPGDHVLYFVGKAEGIVHIDREDYHVAPGTSVFVPADYPHGVKTYDKETSALSFIAIGHPHKHVTSKHRMMRVTDEGVPVFCPKCQAEGLMETEDQFFCVKCGWHTHDKKHVASIIWSEGE